MDKRNKLTPLRNEICTDPEFYRSRNSQETIPVARLILFGKYLEGELDQESSEQLRLHLEKCSFCTREFQELKNVDDLTAATEIPVGVCPSSAVLDHYQFDRASLSTTQITKIQVHLKRCNLCTEELEWLKDLEGSHKKRQHSSYNWFQSALAAAAAVVLALSTFIFWQKSTGKASDHELRALARIEEPDQINYAALMETSEPLKKDLKATFEKGIQAFRSRQFEKARSDFETIVQNQPNHSASLFILAHCYYELSEPEKAFKLCSLSHDVHPHSFERCIFLVNLALKTGHFDHARIEIATLHHEAPDQPEVKRLYPEVMRLTAPSRKL
jgi:tetratricopeptide (TPR) repeat protein